jgi:phytoene dehydrogenase-like protein
LAEKLAPTFLEPLRSSHEIKAMIGEELWNEFIASPISETLKRNFTNDVIRGIVLTDGLIGTFTSASEIAANICFLYHLVGNGTGEWRVPKGGMGKLVESLTNRCKALGVEMRSSAEVSRISESSEGVQVELANGERITSRVCLAGFSPEVLKKVANIPAPNYREGSQLKVNMVLTRLPQLRSGLSPETAFAGTFHIDESYSQLELAFE